MAGAGGIRAGGAYVEIFTKDHVRKGLANIQAQLRIMGRFVTDLGKQLLRLGAITAAALGVGIKQASDFEQNLLKIKAAASDLASGDLEKIRAKSLELSQAMGVSPTEITAAMRELIKAGASVEDVLGGMTEAAIHFAMAGELEMTNAAETMHDAMVVFSRDGLTAAKTADALSAAADASSISVDDMTWSFRMGAKVWAGNNQQLTDFTTAVALMGKNAIKGSDAGTSLKTMMLKLAAPIEGAREEMDRLGLRVYDANNQMLKGRNLIAALEQALGGMNAEAQKASLVKIFGSDAIRAAEVMLDEGVKGWDEMEQRITATNTVATKFSILMSGLQGQFKTVMAAVERLSIAFGTALAPVLIAAGDALTALLQMTAIYLQQNQETAVVVVAITLAVVAFGVALITLGLALKLAAFALATLGTLAGVVTVAFAVLKIAVVGLYTMIIAATTVVGFLNTIITGFGIILAIFAIKMAMAAVAAHDFGATFAAVGETVKSAWQGIKDALAMKDLQMALKIAGKALELIWLQITDALTSIWFDFLSGLVVHLLKAVDRIGDALANVVPGLFNAVGLNVGWVEPGKLAELERAQLAAQKSAAGLGNVRAQKRARRELEELTGAAAASAAPVRAAEMLIEKAFGLFGGRRPGGDIDLPGIDRAVEKAVTQQARGQMGGTLATRGLAFGPAMDKSLEVQKDQLDVLEDIDKKLENLPVFG